MKKLLALSLVLVSMFAVGCTKAPVTPNTPPAPVSVEFRITQSLATLVEANKAATEVTISLNKSGVISVDDTKIILTYTGMVAKSSKASLMIMDSKQPLAAKQKAIMDAFTEIQKNEAIKKFLADSKNSDALKAIVAGASTVGLLVNLLATGAF